MKTVLTTFKRIQKPGEPRTRKQRRVMDPCAHVRPRRCCMSCRDFYVRHHGSEEKGLLRFNQALDLYARRPVREG